MIQVYMLIGSDTVHIVKTKNIDHYIAVLKKKFGYNNVGIVRCAPYDEEKFFTYIRSIKGFRKGGRKYKLGVPETYFGSPARACPTCGRLPA